MVGSEAIRTRPMNCGVLYSKSGCRVQNDAFGHFAAGDKLTEGNQQLAGQCHDHLVWVFLSTAFFQCMSFPQFKEGPWSRKPRDISRVTTLYSVDPVLDRNHDAVIRIEGLAPEWWAHSSDRHLCHGLLSGCHRPGSSWSDQRAIRTRPMNCGVLLFKNHVAGFRLDAFGHFAVGDKTFHKATSNLRASATIIFLRIPTGPPTVRCLNHRANSLSGWNFRNRQASWIRPFRTRMLPARAQPFLAPFPGHSRPATPSNHHSAPMHVGSVSGERKVHLPAYRTYRGPSHGSSRVAQPWCDAQTADPGRSSLCVALRPPQSAPGRRAQCIHGASNFGKGIRWDGFCHSGHEALRGIQEPSSDPD